MDLSKFQGAFDKMSYDGNSALKVSLPNTKSTVIVTESSDLNGAAEFIAQSFQSEDPNQIRVILVQSSVEKKFLDMLNLKSANTQGLNKSQLEELKKEYSSLAAKGIELIQSDDSSTGLKSTIVRCPRALIASDNLPIVSLEVFRTTKEGVSFAKSYLSINLWCENISIAFEYINALSNSRQIWLNASHGATNPKIPFYNGAIVCEDSEIRSKATSDIPSSIVQVANNIQFSTAFRANTFQTVVIPFGESFAN